MLDIGKFWLCDKRYCVTNIFTSAVIWFVWKPEIWLEKHGNASFQDCWTAIELDDTRDKKAFVLEFIDKIKMVARTTLWLPYGDQPTT